MRKGEEIMKYLIIKKGLGYFVNREGKEKIIDTISKEDILFLLTQATDVECVFEMDESNDDDIKNEAHKIIYENIYNKFKEFEKNKNIFIDESMALYKAAFEKYKDNGNCDS